MFCHCLGIYYISDFSFEIDNEFMLNKSQGSSFSIETRLQAGESGFTSHPIPSHPIPVMGVLFATSDWLWGPQSLLSSGYLGLFLGGWGKWPGCEADHFPLSSVKVKNVWSYTFAPQICLHGMVLN
jgi:hypothetical protein